MKKKGKKKKIPRSRTLEHFHSFPCPNTKTQILEVLIKWVFEINKKKHKKHIKKTRNIEFPTCWDNQRLCFWGFAEKRSWDWPWKIRSRLVFIYVLSFSSQLSEICWKLTWNSTAGQWNEALVWGWRWCVATNPGPRYTAPGVFPPLETRPCCGDHLVRSMRING